MTIAMDNFSPLRVGDGQKIIHSDERNGLDGGRKERKLSQSRSQYGDKFPASGERSENPKEKP